MTDKPQSTESDVAFIQALAELLNENDLTELSVKRDYGENDSLNVRVISRRAETVTHAAPPPPAPAATQAPASTPAPAEPAPPATEDLASHPGAVTSPMVGTIYLQAEPGAPAFVSIGTQVSEGDTLLIVEAMKTMNHIPAPKSGTVKRILVDDGDAVEYGSILMIIE
ncbi:MAG: acetyl-CoA carboxylase, biotin carboxyl carrier protein [Rhodobacteraceae bacterium HLUCCO07]|nr:MAG: acetyl-CoA carboxylase, biotin carboxyl carrier protein [Rhodobacteraceae bacterium HLUCCO07]